ncbi:unnamed protein product [Schistosoma rodhaini]|uniref:Uncharacterized protein n=1 Tax=Schistosoma rodhaini TaxID=6188 RepID=A0AA85FSL7_9TREM|nr:unnamed protein product [Schistosoma rodhaini]
MKYSYKRNLVFNFVKIQHHLMYYMNVINGESDDFDRFFGSDKPKNYYSHGNYDNPDEYSSYYDDYNNNNNNGKEDNYYSKDRYDDVKEPRKYEEQSDYSYLPNPHKQYESNEGNNYYGNDHDDYKNVDNDDNYNAGGYDSYQTSVNGNYQTQAPDYFAHIKPKNPKFKYHDRILYNWDDYQPNTNYDYQYNGVKPNKYNVYSGNNAEDDDDRQESESRRTTTRPDDDDITF